MKKQIIFYLARILPYVLAGYLVNTVSFLCRTADGRNAGEKILHVFGGSILSKLPVMPSLHPQDILTGVCGALLLYFAVIAKRSSARKYRNGVEYGSARWGTAKDIQPFVDSDPENNMILTATESLTMNPRPKDVRYARNKNVMVVGGSGSGKTRFFAKPNIMQCCGKDFGEISMVITDPKGLLALECGKMLQRHGYEVRLFNTVDFSKSMHYNPLQYIHSEKDILKLVNALIVNTTGDHDSDSDGGFWTKAEKLLYQALIGYIWYEAPEEEQNFSLLLEMLNASEVKEHNDNNTNPLDILFEDLERREPGHFAVRQYRKFKVAAGKTMQSILISCGARLAPLDIRELRELTDYDEMKLDEIGDRKTSLFVIISDTDSTFNFVSAIMYTQLFNLLCEKADASPNGRLKYHVRCILDEFANLGQIPNFERLIATIRSREISACIILQAISQLKTIYEESADTILGNCDTFLFLGGKESTTLSDLSDMLGKETIDFFNTSESRGESRSNSINYQKTGKELMTKDEIAVMDGSKCILQIRGVPPFLSKKYDITKHKRYRELSDADPKNLLNIDDVLHRRLRLHVNDEVEIFNVPI